MPKSAKEDAPPADGPGDAPSFEEALAKLEDIVREMEDDRIPLEELLERYEEGTRLHRLCERRLDSARGRIELIRKNRNGEDVSEDFGAAADAEPAAKTGDRDHREKNGELF